MNQNIKKINSQQHFGINENENVFMDNLDMIIDYQCLVIEYILNNLFK